MSKCSVHYEVQGRYAGPDSNPIYDIFQVQYIPTPELPEDHPRYTKRGEGDDDDWGYDEVRGIFDTPEMASSVAANLWKRAEAWPQQPHNMEYRAVRVNTRVIS